MRIAVTGSSGFIGAALVTYLREQAHDVLTLSRMDMLEADLSTVHAIIHCAGLAHRSGRGSPKFEEFDAVNNLLTQQLATRAHQFGVKRFVFVSTINVVAGNPSPLSPDMPPSPLNDYGRSKAAAERFLLAIKDMEIVIARPCLVYGADAPGNFSSLMGLLRSPITLPLGKANNKRNFLSISNAVRALEFLAETNAQKVSGQIFHLGEPVPLSTVEIITRCRTATGHPVKLMGVPKPFMKAVFSLLGKNELYRKLFDDLEVDTSSLISTGFNYNYEHAAANMIEMARASGKHRCMGILQQP